MKFERQHGHCNVPQKYSQNPSLGAWVAQQRRRYKHGTLSAKRIMLMERVGVEWALRRGWSPSLFHFLCALALLSCYHSSCARIHRDSLTLMLGLLALLLLGHTRSPSLSQTNPDCFDSDRQAGTLTEAGTLLAMVCNLLCTRQGHQARMLTGRVKSLGQRPHPRDRGQVMGRQESC